MTSYTLTVALNVHEESEHLAWAIQTGSPLANVETNIGSSLNGLFTFNPVPGVQDTLTMLIYGTSENEVIYSMNLNECYLISKPRVAYKGAKSGLPPGSYPYNSPFGANDNPHNAVQTFLLSANSNMISTSTNSIGIPTTQSVFQTVSTAIATKTLSNVGRWKHTLVIGIAFNMSQGGTTHFRTFTLDPEFQVTNGSKPNDDA